MKRRYSWPLGIFAVVVVLLIALHIALPYMVRDYLNEKLADMGALDHRFCLCRISYRFNFHMINFWGSIAPCPALDQ